MLVKKILLLLRTLRYLKPTQVFYQIWYRIKRPFVRLEKYTALDGCVLQRVRFTSPQLIPSENRYLGDGLFRFLNKEHRFSGGIDWEFMSHGKLWNYNLQYFDYLHDASIPFETKTELVESAAAWLLSRNASPEPYAVSLRLINWIFFHSETGYRSPQFELLIQRETDYLRNNPEKHIQANHLLENYLALTIAGIALQQDAFVSKTGEHLLAQLNEQLLDDGAHYECSPMYHNILLSRLLLVIDALQPLQQHKTLHAQLSKKASAMMGWMLAVKFNNNTIAFCNDAAENIAAGIETIIKACQSSGITPEIKQLNNSGYWKMESNGFELLADAGNVLPSYQPGHLHADMLSFLLHYNQKPVFIDTGTSTYENNARRHYERSTAAHNTVTIGNSNQSEVWSSFRVGARAEIISRQKGENFLEASHNGYKRKFNAIHTRRFEMDAATGAVKINDEIHPVTNASCIAYFHLHRDVTVISNAGNEIHLSNGLKIHFQHAIKIETEKYEYATGFNQLEKSQRLAVFFSGELLSFISIHD